MTKRVKKGEPYWYITSNCTGHLWKVELAYEYHHDLDNWRFDQGNYFTTEDDADKFLDRIKGLFKDRNDV